MSPVRFAQGAQMSPERADEVILSPNRLIHDLMSEFGRARTNPTRAWQQRTAMNEARDTLLTLHDYCHPLDSAVVPGRAHFPPNAKSVMRVLMVETSAEDARESEPTSGRRADTRRMPSSNTSTELQGRANVLLSSDSTS
jgi:hypothetical protein